MYIDLSYLEYISQRQYNIMVEIMESILVQEKEIMKILADETAKGNWEQVAQKAHKFKGSVKIVGAEILKNELQQIENMAKEQTSPDDIIAKLQEVISISAESMEELRAKLNSVAARA